MKFLIVYSITLFATVQHINCATIENKKLPSISFGPLKSLSLPSDSLPGNLGWSSSVEQLVNTVGGNVASPVVKQVIAAGKNATKLDKEAAHVVVHTLIKHLANCKNGTISKSGTKIEAGHIVGKNGTIINGKLENKNVTGNGTKIINESGNNATLTNGKLDSKNATAENGKNSTNTHEPIGNKNTTAAHNGTAKADDNSSKNGTVVDHPNLKNQTSENGKNSTTKADSPAAAAAADDKQKPTGTTADKAKPGDSKNKPEAGDKKGAGKKGAGPAGKKSNNGNKANAPGQKKKEGAAKK